MEKRSIMIVETEKKRLPTTGRQTVMVNERRLNPDPSINPIFQKVAGRNLSHGGGIGMIMRNQVLNYYGAVETQSEPILTSSENRAKQEGEREIILAIERARLAALKATQDAEWNSPKQVRSVEAPVPDKLKKKEADAAAAPLLEEEPAEVKPKRTKHHKKERRPVLEEPEVEKIEEVAPEPFVSLWDKYADEPPPEVEVGSEVAQPPPPRPPYEFSGPKMYNVLLQVGPRDITRVTEGADALDLATNASKYKLIVPSPRLMDVMAMVRPREKNKAELETEKAEADQALFKNVYTQARPRGYKELDLAAADDGCQSEEKKIQVTELEIEKSIALSGGRRLREGTVLWPNILEYNSDLTEIKIKTYIRSFWKIGADWMFDVRFIQTFTTNYRKKFIYEVVFSKPTNEFPVPPATASVFFIFETEHYACPDHTMKVKYLLEGNRYPYKPGSVEFREEWLSSIIEDKLQIRKAIHF